MEREAPLEPEVEQLQKSTDGEDGGGEDAPSVPSGVSEASSNLAADDVQGNKGGFHDTSPERVEDGNKYSTNRDGSQREKEHQAVRRKNKSHHHLHGGASDKEKGMSKNSGISLSQTPESGQNLPLKKCPLKSATCHTDKKEYCFLEQGENSKQSQEGTGTATREKSSECSTSDKGLRVNSDMQVPRSIHLEKKSYKRVERGMSYKGTLGLKREQNDHTGEIPYKYAKANLHRYHLRRHQRRYKCKICGKSFKSSTSLAFHQHTNTGERPYKCDECGKAFRQPGYLIQHKRKHTGGKPYKCIECGRSYMYSNSLTVHLRTHTGERPYKCDECRKAFNQYAHLKKHKQMHTVESLNKCKICGKNYKYSTSLAYDQQTHTGERPYNCDACGMAFKQSADLTKHKQFHTGERPYKCDECGMAFKQSGDLTKHKRIHTGERPYKCDDCGKAFRNHGHLTRHKRTHTGERPFKCDACGMAFMQSGDLTRHKRTHTGERPYKCEECGKAFQMQSSLKSHKRIHTGEKPYRCDSCGMAFKWSQQLSRHQQTHTEDDGQEDKGGIHQGYPEHVEDGNEHNNNRDGSQSQKECQGKWRKDKPCPHLRGDASEEEMGMSKNRSLSVPQSPVSVQKMPLKKRPLKSATGHAVGKKYYHSEQGEGSKQSQEKSNECSTSDKGIRVNSHPQVSH